MDEVRRAREVLDEARASLTAAWPFSGQTRR